MSYRKICTKKENVGMTRMYLKSAVFHRVGAEISDKWIVRDETSNLNEVLSMRQGFQNLPCWQ